MAKARAPEKPFRVVPAPGRPGSVIVALPDGAAMRTFVDTWVSRAHTGIVARPFRLESSVEKKWWRYHLTPGEGYSLAQYLRAVAAKAKVAAMRDITRRFAQDIERGMVMQIHKGGVEGLAAMIEGKPIPTLYFLHAPGCEACEMLKPEVAVWWRVNKHRVRIVPIDLTRAEWKAKSWEPNMTPTLIVRWPDGRLSKFLEGYEPGAFLRWVEEVLR